MNSPRPPPVASDMEAENNSSDEWKNGAGHVKDFGRLCVAWKCHQGTARKHAEHHNQSPSNGCFHRFLPLRCLLLNSLLFEPQPPLPQDEGSARNHVGQRCSVGESPVRSPSPRACVCQQGRPHFHGLHRGVSYAVIRTALKDPRRAAVRRRTVVAEKHRRCLRQLSMSDMAIMRSSSLIPIAE